MEQREHSDLRTAAILLEKPGIGIRLLNLMGDPIEGMLRVLPKWLGQTIGYMATRAVGISFHVALSTIDSKRLGRSLRWTHRGMVLASGAVGSR